MSSLINYYHILWEKNDIFLLDFVLNMIQNFLDKSIYIYKMASQFHLKFILQKPLITVNCIVPENIHTPPTEGIGIYWGVGGGGGL